MDRELEQLNDFYKIAMDKAHEWGLEPFPTDFHIVPSHRVYEIASYGVPGHFSHWSYGKSYWQQKTNYDRGYGRIYELVINSNPAQAFLLDTNTMLDNLFVIAHVIGHSDFFANNAYFAHTNRHIEQSAVAAAERFREYEIEFGRGVVEDFIDDVFTIAEHIDPNLNIRPKDDQYEISFETDPYIDVFPEESERRRAIELEEYNRKQHKFPQEPTRDLLGFIAKYGRLKEWQRDIVSTIRSDEIYLLPQRQTKIMNEGWASIMHHELMHELDVECDPGGIDFADVHSGVLSPRMGNLNPYWLGYNMFKRIIEVGDLKAELPKSEVGKPGGPGWKDCLEIRAIERDETFIRNYLDEKLCENLDLFSYEFGETSETEFASITNKNWRQIRDQLVASKSNMGMPYIVVEDGDYERSGGLVLKHEYDGRPLQEVWAQKTLLSIERLWGRPVRLESEDDSEKIIYKSIGGVVTLSKEEK